MLILLLFIHLFFLINLQFTAWPEMMSFPYLISQGFVLYKDMVHAYPPLIVSILAILFKIFGYKLIVLQIFAWVSILVSDFFVYLIFIKLTKNKTFALIGVFLLVLFQPFLQGNMVWPDLNLIPFVLCAFYLLLNKKYFWFGVFIALACLIKQTAVLYIVLSIMYIGFATKEKNNFKYYFLGVTCVFFPFGLWLLINNNFIDFVNWTIVYPSRYWTNFPGYVNTLPSRHNFLIIFLLVFPSLFLIIKSKLKYFDTNSKFILLMVIAGFIGTYPRFSFFHFQSALVFIILLTGYVFSKTKNRSLILLLYFVVLFIYLTRPVLTTDWNKPARFYSTEDLYLADKIKANSGAKDKIFLLGLPSSLYTLSDRLPPKPWIDNFGWYFEIPKVQQNMLKRWETDPPKLIFMNEPDHGNWFDLGVYRPKEVLNYVQAYYTRMVEIESGIWMWTRKK